ncbi:S41 family peptidase [Tannockella kyphosi]|uniref:S41 family peptidase n=1 Tax=Tannockella kyphosi TaxID=2899121 RepID=UPI002012F9E1|nr:S41 family peptidase [Tannockella kyphosi]
MNKNIRKKKYNIAFIVSFIINVMLVVCLAVSLLFQDTTIVLNSEKALFDEAYEVIESKWYNGSGEDIDFESNSIEGLVDGLGDAHSSYLTVEEAATFNDSVSGTYVGIGVGFHMLETGGMITRVYEETPSSELGLEVGDIIMEADGTSLEGLTSDEVVDLIRGEEGTYVTLTILRGTEEFSVDVPREDVDISTEYEIRTYNGTLFGYIEITTFGTSTSSEVEAALQVFEATGVETLVIDLRDNGGGYLSAASDILDLFIEAGDPIYQMQGNSGPAEVTYATNCTKYHFDSGYILINESSASASELVTTSLQDMLDYTIVGTTSYGKGTAQTQYQLSDGSILKYTYARWLSANGQYIDEVGIIPDVEVENLDISNISTADLTTDLSEDMVDTGVLALQKMLVILGYDVDRQDGYFSESTKEALEAFEADYGLEVDGVYSNADHHYLIGRTMICIQDDANDLQYKAVLTMLN